jgi:hypothetical protein
VEAAHADGGGGMNYAHTLCDLHEAMTQCEQAPGLNMLGHGQSVHAKYGQLMAQLEAGHPPCPLLGEIHAAFIWPATATLERYHVYHDCGKHLVATVNAEGKRQFPGHAQASAKQYARLFPEDLTTAHLIAHDMDFHTLRGDDLVALCADPLAPVLYLTAWAEVYANAEMFGGLTSDSFKIKSKRLIQAGKKLLLTPTHGALSHV